jgi:hypothetical protein
MAKPEQMFEIRPVTNGKPSADCIAYGTLPEVMEYVPQSRARAEAEEGLARAKQDAATVTASTARGLATITDTLTRIADRALSMSKRVDALAAQKARRDQQAKEQAEAKVVEDMLNRLPDPDKADDTPAVGGHLHAIGPVEKQSADAETGDIPQELEEGAPHFLGPNNVRPKESPYKNPAAMSLA